MNTGWQLAGCWIRGGANCEMTSAPSMPYLSRGTCPEHSHRLGKWQSGHPFIRAHALRTQPPAQEISARVSSARVQRDDMPAAVQSAGPCPPLAARCLWRQRTLSFAHLLLYIRVDIRCRCYDLQPCFQSQTFAGLQLPGMPTRFVRLN